MAPLLLPYNPGVWSSAGELAWPSTPTAVSASGRKKRWRAARRPERRWSVFLFSFFSFTFIPFKNDGDAAEMNVSERWNECKYVCVCVCVCSNKTHGSPSAALCLPACGPAPVRPQTGDDGQTRWGQCDLFQLPPLSSELL